jgi:hypothetical protein
VAEAIITIRKFVKSWKSFIYKELNIALSESQALSLDKGKTRLYTCSDPPDENKQIENFFFTLSETRVSPTLRRTMRWRIALRG